MKLNYRRLGDYIEAVKVRNTDLKAKDLLGININKHFMPSVANIVGTDLSNYKLVQKNQFACNRMHVGRDYRIPIAVSENDEPFMVSPAYDVFEIKKPKELLPEYLMMWFERSEFDRNAWFYTDADVRGGLAWQAFEDMQLPIPHIAEQQEIVKEYNSIQNRIALNQKLIQKLEETAQAIYREWFVEDIDLENLPEGWRIGTISDIATIVMGQSPEGETYNKDGNGMIFYQGRTDFGYRFPDITTYTTNPKKKALKDDILISVRAPVGDLNITTQDCAIGRGLAALRSKLKCNSHLFYTLQNLKSHFDISDGEGTIFGSINKDDLHNLEIVFSENKIKDFDKIVRPIDDCIKIYCIQNQKLTELKALLLSRLASV